MPNGSLREKILAELHVILSSACAGLLVAGPDQVEHPLPVREWLLCLETVEESIQRRSTGPGSRAYLEFIAGFTPLDIDLSHTGSAMVQEPSGPAPDKP